MRRASQSGYCCAVAPDSVGFDAKGKKTLAHPNYKIIQDMWHPDLSQGKQPADFLHKSSRNIWLRCPGCVHGCGRQHEWEASPDNLTRYGGGIKCPYCVSMRSKFCPCRSVAEDLRLSKEWHPDNPTPADQVAKNSETKYRWKCPEGHDSYLSSCKSRCHSNSGCPVCALKRPRLPTVSVGRADLAAEWNQRMNTKSPSEVTLGSAYKAWWICSRNADHPSWQAMVFNRAMKGTGCPACRGKNSLNQPERRMFGVQAD